jgi:Flp pilus assembly pilin Flp
MKSAIVHIQGIAPTVPREGIGMTNEILRFIRNEPAATAVEYGVIVAGLSHAATTPFSNLGSASTRNPAQCRPH